MATKKQSEIIHIRSRLRCCCFRNQDSLCPRSASRSSSDHRGSSIVGEDVRVPERRSWLVYISMMGLGLGLGDGGRGIYACVEGVTTDGNGGIKCLRVEVL